MDYTSRELNQFNKSSQNRMQDGDHFFFWKKYRVAVKNDQDFFNIKYQINNPDGYPNYVDPQAPTSKHHDHPPSKKSRKSSSNSSEVQNKVKKWKSKRKLKREESQGQIDPIPDLRKMFPDLSLKQQKHSHLQLENFSSAMSEEEELEEDHSSISASSNEDQPSQFFTSHKQIAFIELSRENKEQKFYKGKVEFSEYLKTSAKVISDEVEGYLVVEGSHLNRCLHEDEVYFTIIQSSKEQTSCSVVAIITRRNPFIVGKVQLVPEKKIYIVKPINKRISKLMVEGESLDEKVIKNIDSHYFLVEFTNWVAHDHYPSCRIIEEYGLIGEIEVEAKAIMRTHGVNYLPYSKNEKHKIVDELGECLKEGSISIPEGERKVRKDFRRWKTFIVKANPYDFVLSLYPFSIRDNKDPNFLKKDIYEINIHFLDVAYYVKKQSLLDELLRKRLTSFNAVFTTFPLLPKPILSAITFKLGEERMTLSVCLQVDEDGTIQEITKISSSIVRPECLFSLEQLQRIMEEESLSEEEYKGWNCGLTTNKEIWSYIKDARLITSLMDKVRQNRISEGSFSFEAPTKSFQLDEKGKPQHFDLLNKTQAYLVLHQCSIVAQQKIGEYLFANLKEKAILYRHKFPGEKKLQKLKELGVKLGHPILSSLKSEFHRDINELMADPNIKPHLKEMMKDQILLFLTQADYFQIENFDPSSWNNYMINIPIYAHCSAPTKRYADIVVQRQLSALITRNKQCLIDQSQGELLQEANKYLETTKRVKDECQKVLLCQYLALNPVFTTAVILYIEKWGVKLNVLRYGLKAVIKLGKITNLSRSKTEYDNSRLKSVKFEFKGGQGEPVTFVLRELSEVEVRVTSTKSFPLNYLVSLAVPHPRQPNNKIIIQ